MRFPFRQIEDILDEANDKYRRINWGGCGIMAGILAQHLEPIVHDIRIVACRSYGDSADIDEARKNVNNNSMFNWECEGVGFAHIWVEFKWNSNWYAIDATGIKSRSKMLKNWSKPGAGSFTVKEIKAISNNTQGWNSVFNRDQIPSMRNSMGRQFNNLLHWQ